MKWTGDNSNWHDEPNEIYKIIKTVNLCHVKCIYIFWTQLQNLRDIYDDVCKLCNQFNRENFQKCYMHNITN